MTKVLSIDFDGVIHDFKHPIEGKRMGGPIPGTKAALKFLIDNGYTIIIFSVRAGSESGKKSIKDFMEYYNLPYDEITNEKTKSDYYVDDNGLRFHDWEETLKKIK